MGLRRLYLVNAEIAGLADDINGLTDPINNAKSMEQ
jgi:hypothetical protein